MAVEAATRSDGSSPIVVLVSDLTTEDVRRRLGATKLPVRADIVDGIAVAWDELGRPGEWLTGAQRAAVVVEVRNAWECRICAERKAAVSPYSVTEEHPSYDGLPPSWVDVVHRLTTDSARLTRRWYEDSLATGIVENELIELISVTCIAVTIDSFLEAIGVAWLAPPLVSTEAPARQHQPMAARGPGWAQTIAPEDADGDFADFYADDMGFYIRRALTLEPTEARRFFALMDRLYLHDPRVRELDGYDRAVSRAQMEFLAARTSALLECFY